MRGSNWLTMTLLVTVLLVAAASDARAWSTTSTAPMHKAVCDSSQLLRLRGGFGVIGISGNNNIKTTGSNPNLGGAMGSGSMSGTTTPPATDGRSESPSQTHTPNSSPEHIPVPTCRVQTIHICLHTCSLTACGLSMMRFPVLLPLKTPRPQRKKHHPHARLDQMCSCMQRISLDT